MECGREGFPALFYEQKGAAGSFSQFFLENR
jgi:hypothetical protein